MEKTPPPELLSYSAGGTNHAFFASIDICSDCHTSIDGKSLQAATESEVEALMDETEAAITALMNAVLATNDVTLTEAEDDTGATVTNVAIPLGTTVSVDNFGESHGRQAMDLTVDPGGPGETTYHVQLRRVELGVPASGTNLFATYNEGVVILKAGWNILMIENDGSLGVHNPSFSNTVLGAARNVLLITDFSTPTLVP